MFDHIRLQLCGCMFYFVLLGTSCNLFRYSSPNQPFVVSSVDALAETAYVCEIYGWADEVASIPAFAINNLMRIQPSSYYDTQEVWTTDKWILGWCGRRKAILHMPCNEELDEWGKRHFSKPEYHNLYIKLDNNSSRVNKRFNKGGSIIATPVLHEYPYGRLILSKDLDFKIKKFLHNQRVQVGRDGNFLEIDTAWLKVGHVDELVNFLPISDRSGFKLVVPAPQKGLQIIKEMAEKFPARAMFYEPGSKELEGSVTGSENRWIEVSEADIPSEKWTYVRIWKGKGAGQVAKVHKIDRNRIIIEHVWDLRYLKILSEGTNKYSASGKMAIAIEGFCDEMPVWFDLPDETSRFLLVTESRMWISANGKEIPAVMAISELAKDPLLARVNYEADIRCQQIERYLRNALGLQSSDVLYIPVLFASAYKDFSNVFTLIPNNVNFQVFNNEVICLRSCGPRIDLSDDNTDCFLQMTRQILSSTGLNVHILDGWNALHRNNGGARCGINVWRRLKAN